MGVSVCAIAAIHHYPFMIRTTKTGIDPAYESYTIYTVGSYSCELRKHEIHCIYVETKLTKTFGWKKCTRFIYKDVQLIILPCVYFKIWKNVLRKQDKKTVKNQVLILKKPLASIWVFTKVTIFVRINLSRKYKHFKFQFLTSNHAHTRYGRGNSTAECISWTA